MSHSVSDRVKKYIKTTRKTAVVEYENVNKESDENIVNSIPSIHLNKGTTVYMGKMADFQNDEISHCVKNV